MGTVKARPEHEVVYQELVALCSKHAEKLEPIEILAIAANMLGKLVAGQDQRVTTPEQAMEVVVMNMELGNQQALAILDKPAGRA